MNPEEISKKPSNICSSLLTASTPQEREACAEKLVQEATDPKNLLTFATISAMSSGYEMGRSLRPAFQRGSSLFSQAVDKLRAFFK